MNIISAQNLGEKTTLFVVLWFFLFVFFSLFVCVCVCVCGRKSVFIISALKFRKKKSFLYARLKNGTYYVTGYGVCPSVRKLFRFPLTPPTVYI